MLPVIEREMRVLGRQRFTYYVRSFGALLAVVACALFGLESGFDTGLGSRLFAFLHSTIFCAIWICVPLLTADCISRERREGTLGLLFLTHLTANSIVLAKTLAQALRGFTLWLAILPVVMVSLLMGGVDWMQPVLSVLINFSSLCIALAAGICASSWNKVWTRALVTALILAGVLLLAMAALTGSLLWSLIMSLLSPGSVLNESATLLGLAFLFTGQWADYLPLTSWPQVFLNAGQVALCSVLLLVAATRVAGINTKRSWQELPPSPLVRWLNQTFCTPVIWRGYFHKWIRRKLERNPIGWLEQRRWTGRLVTWSWLAIMITLFTVIISSRNFDRVFKDLQVPIAWSLVGSTAVSAAGSFRRERESGLLELILVTPLKESEIISGRLRGLWGQFFPAAALLVMFWAYLASLIPYLDASRHIVQTAVALVLLPIIGLSYSLRCRGFVTAFGCTLAVGVIVPALVSTAIMWFSWFSAGADAPFDDLALTSLFCVLQAIIAGLCGMRLVRALKHRTFALAEGRTFS